LAAAREQSGRDGGLGCSVGLGRAAARIAAHFGGGDLRTESGGEGVSSMRMEGY